MSLELLTKVFLSHKNFQDFKVTEKNATRAAAVVKGEHPESGEQTAYILLDNNNIKPSVLKKKTDELIYSGIKRVSPVFNGDSKDFYRNANDIKFTERPVNWDNLYHRQSYDELSKAIRFSALEQLAAQSQTNFKSDNKFKLRYLIGEVFEDSFEATSKGYTGLVITFKPALSVRKESAKGMYPVDYHLKTIGIPVKYRGLRFPYGQETDGRRGPFTQLELGL